ncbi:MAG: anaerobic sulfatase maturase [Myxococcota bacterium]
MNRDRSLSILQEGDRATEFPSLPALWPKDAPRAFHVLAKPSGAACNLDCDYCFYLEKEALYPGSSMRMNDEVLELYLRQLLESQRGNEIVIAWQGGEPTLMGLDFFQRAMSIVEKYRPPQARLSHTLQTNGVLLDEEWCGFLKKHDFLVGLSIDGPQRMHDAYRRDKGGKSTFARVRQAALMLREQGVAVNALCSVHAKNEKNPREVYRFLRDELGLRFLQFIPIVETDCLGQGEETIRFSARTVQSHAWGDFLSQVFDEWLRKDVGRVFVQIFESALASWLGLPPSLCIFAETCGDALALEHNGDVYSCDHFVEEAHLLGNIRDTHLLAMVASERQRQFGEAKKKELPAECLRCDVLFACRGDSCRQRTGSYG